MKSKYVDLGLLLIISASIAAIGYQISKSQKSALSEGISEKPNVTIPSSSTLKVLNVRPEDFLFSLPFVDEEAWSTLVVKTGLKKHSRTTSPVCSSGKKARSVYGFTHRLAKAAFLRGGLRTMFGQRYLDCVQTGSEVEFYFYSANEEDPYVERLGVTVLKELYYLRRNEITADFFAEFNTDREKYLEYINAVPTLVDKSNEHDQIFRFSEPRTDLPELENPPAFAPFGEVYRTAELNQISAENQNKLVFVDVRSKEEFNRGTIPGAISLPVELPAGAPSNFSSKLKNVHLIKARFDLVPLLAFKDKRVVIFGSSPRDVRSYAVLRELAMVRTIKFGWFYDGYQKSP